MNITNWNPLREIEEIFDRYNHRIGVPLLESGGGREMLTAADWCPAVDIEETGKEFLLKVELPEVNKDDVKVTINKDTPCNYSVNMPRQIGSSLSMFETKTSVFYENRTACHKSWIQ